mmetsp:Transcript_65536/g.165124  ORF Transcript_65536/g.165124 Transcript_65536/m.165124 type:complete len:261 (-) Transcript_65536:581-1363(-)
MARPLASTECTKCTVQPARLPGGGSSMNDSLCTKRSPSNLPGLTMNPQGSRQERRVPSQTSSVPSSATTGSRAFGRPPVGLNNGALGAESEPWTDSPMMTLAAQARPLRSVVTSNVTLWSIVTSSSRSGFQSNWRASMWQNKSPSKLSGATMKPQSFFHERMTPVRAPAPSKSSGPGTGSVTCVAVARPFWSTPITKLTCLPATGGDSSSKWSLWQKTSPSNFAGQTKKPQSPFQLLISARSLLPASCSSTASLALVEPD